MNHKSFWEKYISIASDEESKAYLKTYLFSLPPLEMKKWILSEAQSIIMDLKKQLYDPNVAETWKTTLKEQLETAVLNIEHLSNISHTRKAA